MTCVCTQILTSLKQAVLFWSQHEWWWTPAKAFFVCMLGGAVGWCKHPTLSNPQKVCPWVVYLTRLRATRCCKLGPASLNDWIVHRYTLHNFAVIACSIAFLITHPLTLRIFAICSWPISPPLASGSNNDCCSSNAVWVGKLQAPSLTPFALSRACLYLTTYRVVSCIIMISPISTTNTLIYMSASLQNRPYYGQWLAPLHSEPYHQT